MLDQYFDVIQENFFPLYTELRVQSEKKNSSGPDRVIVTSTLSEKQRTTDNLNLILKNNHEKVGEIQEL